MAILSGKIAGAILLASLACSQTLSFVDSQNQTITNGHLIPRNIGSNDVQGIVVCAGEGELFLEMLTMVEHVRYALLSQLPIAIAHCNELTEESILIASSIPDVRVLNLCAGRHSFAKSLRSRLTGFFCKPAALLQSPFQHTILVDTDVIFFKRPERLFKTPQYLVTGTLFFRDRWTQTASKISLTEGTGSASYALEFLHSAVEALNQHNKKGNRHQFSPIMDFSPSNLSLSNAFWRHLASKGGFTPDHWQDSSVVVFNSLSHPRTLAIIRSQLGSFSLGYGDKELFWLAATAAGEAFAFEPHIAASLGNCGALLHYDPALPAPSNSTETGGREDVRVEGNGYIRGDSEPFYINAEYLIDQRKLRHVGDFLGPPHNVISAPLLMDERKTPLYKLEKWQKMDHGFYPCGHCIHAPCVAMANSSIFIEQIKLRQKIILLFRERFFNDKLAMNLSSYQATFKEYAGELRALSSSPAIR